MLQEQFSTIDYDSDKIEKAKDPTARKLTLWRKQSIHKERDNWC